MGLSRITDKQSEGEKPKTVAEEETARTILIDGSRLETIV